MDMEKTLNNYLDLEISRILSNEQKAHEKARLESILDDIRRCETELKIARSNISIEESLIDSLKDCFRDVKGPHKQKKRKEFLRDIKHREEILMTLKEKPREVFYKHGFVDEEDLRSKKAVVKANLSMADMNDWNPEESITHYQSINRMRNYLKELSRPDLLKTIPKLNKLMAGKKQAVEKMTGISDEAKEQLFHMISATQTSLNYDKLVHDSRKKS